MEVLESSGVSDASVASCGDGSEQHSCCVEGSENLGEHILEDFDSYMEDINGRLTILRMVSDSVIKGMVTAFEQEAINKIAMKELEVAKLKETLLFYHVGADETELSSSPLKYRFYCSGSDPLVEHCTMRESLSNSIVEAKNQFKKLKTEIDNMRGCSSLTRMSSGSDLVGLVGIQRDNASERWVDVDERLHSLQSSLDNVYRQAECTAYLSKVSFDEWQQEQVFQEEIKDMVISNCFRSLQEEFEERLWDLNAQLCGSESVKWLERTNEISNLRQDLNTIYKSLSMSESEQLTSHGSLNNFEEWNNSKKTDHFDRKVLSSHVSFSPLFSEGNGKHESESIMLKNLEPLKIMSKDELLDHFKAEMTKMKRDHESEVQKMTDHYFSLKREYLKERECVPLKRGHSLPLKRDKDFDILRKKIPEVILKLDDILVENEKLPASNNLAKNIGSLKDRLHVLLAENRQLRDSLADKKKEVKRLSSQVSDASDKLLKHSVTEANLLKIISSLEGVIEDAHLKASISDGVCKCVLEEGIGLIKYNCKESHVESAHNAKAGSRCEIQDSDIESVIMEGLLGIIYREAVKDVEVKVSKLYEKYIKENSCLQLKLLDKEKALTVEAEEKERFKQEVLLLKSEIGVKEKFTLEAAAELAKEKQQFELANQEINRLRDHRDQQESLISECNIELDTLKCELAEAVEQINLYKVETSKLNQKLETAMKEVMETNEQKRVLLAGTQDRQTTLSVIEVQEMEHRKQMESTILFVHGLAKTVAEFECRVAEDIKNKSSRVKTVNSHIQKLRRTGLRYKQKLEKRCSDLRKAEAEVDLLGDEVDALLSLLEKIYIALDHYSPILQHYPGIIEILKLVRRELSGESTKLF